MSHETTLSMLKDLIATSKAGERGYALATQDNREPGVIDLLKDGEESCRAAAVELQDQVRLLGEAPEPPGAPPVYRGWINFDAVVIARDTKLILEECERGQDYAKSRYSDAMTVELPDSVRVIVERQYQRVIAIRDRLRLLRNRYPATEIPRVVGSRPDPRR